MAMSEGESNYNAGNRGVLNSSGSSKRTRVYASCLRANLISANGEVVEPQDADYLYVPPLSNELALLVLARVPRSEHAKLCFVNKRYLVLLRSGELYKIRREIGVKEPLVFMLASGESHWWAVNPWTGSCRKIPVLPSDQCFTSGDKESVCAGTHLLVSGNEFEGLVTWRYDLVTDCWFKGPSMISPRCLFASANCGNFAFVAGGVVIGSGVEVLNSAERYNPDNQSWDLLPRMIRCRKLCSGCYMDNKFYVIGGIDEDNNHLTCGEFYDVEKKMWVLVPDMIEDSPDEPFRSPPLVAVANNQLYLLDTSSNQLKVYLKESKSWKELGEVPVRADGSRGWGVAFKSLGDQLLVIGGSPNSAVGQRMMMFTCLPDPTGDVLQWRFLSGNGNYTSSFIFNCSVMVA